jgi:Ca2+-binding EF-hand superfamily protein
MRIYKSKVAQKIIKATDLRQLMKEHHYKGSNPGDIDIVIKFFKSVKDESSVNFIKIVSYARQIDPTYGKDLGAKGDAEAAKKAAAAFPHAIKRVLKKLSDHLRDNRMTRELLFEQMDTDKSGFINKKELTAFYTISLEGQSDVQRLNNKIEGVSDADISKLFNFLDINGDGEISIHELTSLVEGVDLSLDLRMKSFSPEFETQLTKEIGILFDILTKKEGN